MRFSLLPLAQNTQHFAPADSARAAGASAIVAEIATFQLNDGISDADFINISKTSEAFVAAAAGFISRKLSKGEDGVWTDYVLWQDMEAAQLAGKAFFEQDFCQTLMAAINPGTVLMRHQHVLWQME